MHPRLVCLQHGRPLGDRLGPLLYLPVCAVCVKTAQDFSGFRLLLLVPRERVMWPAPGQYDKPELKKHPKLGAPLDPLPQLMVRVLLD